MNTQTLKTLTHIATQIDLPQTKSLVIQYWSENNDPLLCEELEKAFSSRGISTGFIDFSPKSIASKTLNGTFNLTDAEQSLIASSDTFLDVMAITPQQLMMLLTETDQTAFRSFIRSHFSELMHSQKPLLQLRLPTRAFSEMAEMSFETYEKLWRKLSNIDYKLLKATCKNEIDRLSQTQSVTIKSGEDQCLSLSYHARKWHSDHGNGDFPAGEVYVAVLEDSANGEFVTGKIMWDGTWYDRVRLSFSNGRLIHSEPKVIYEQLSAIAPSALVIAEFGIGLNPQATDYTGYALFDEKQKGTCHIALGMNQYFGGVNDAPVHYDFVTTPSALNYK